MFKNIIRWNDRPPVCLFFSIFTSFRRFLFHPELYTSMWKLPPTFWSSVAFSLKLFIKSHYGWKWVVSKVRAHFYQFSTAIKDRHGKPTFRKPPLIWIVHQSSHFKYDIAVAEIVWKFWSMAPVFQNSGSSIHFLEYPIFGFWHRFHNKSVTGLNFRCLIQFHNLSRQYRHTLICVRIWNPLHFKLITDWKERVKPTASDVNEILFSENQ